MDVIATQIRATLGFDDAQFALGLLYYDGTGVPRDRVIVVPDGQSGLKMVQDGRIDAYSLPVLSINDLVKKANDPNLEVIAPVEGAPV